MIAETILNRKEKFGELAILISKLSVKLQQLKQIGTGMRIDINTNQWNRTERL